MGAGGNQNDNVSFATQAEIEQGTGLRKAIDPAKLSVSKPKMDNTTLDIDLFVKKFSILTKLAGMEFSIYNCYGMMYDYTTDKCLYINASDSESFWDSTDVHGNMKRLVLDKTGAILGDYNPDTTYTATQTIMVQTPQFHVIHKKHNNKLYLLMNTVPFTFSPDGGTTVWNSWLDEAFDTATGIKDYRYIGAYESYLGRSTHDVLPTTSKTRAQFRTEHVNWGTGYSQLDYYTWQMMLRLLYMEAGRLHIAGYKDKWDGYLHAATYSDNRRRNTGLTKYMGNRTGVIIGSNGVDTSDLVIANSFRGIENYYGHIWKFMDGININSGQVYLAKSLSTFTDNTSNSPYVDVGLLNPNATGYISDHHDGYFIPSDNTGNPVKYVGDYYWYDTGWRVVRVGARLLFSAHGGPSTFGASNSSTHLYTSDGSRAVR